MDSPRATDSNLRKDVAAVMGVAEAEITILEVSPDKWIKGWHTPAEVAFTIMKKAITKDTVPKEPKVEGKWGQTATKTTMASMSEAVEITWTMPKIASIEGENAGSRIFPFTATALNYAAREVSAPQHQPTIAPVDTLTDLYFSWQSFITLLGHTQPAAKIQGLDGDGNTMAGLASNIENAAKMKNLEALYGSNEAEKAKLGKSLKALKDLHGAGGARGGGIRRADTLAA